MRALIVWMMLALPVLAQPPRGMFNWWESPLTRDISLTEDQRKQIRDTISEFRPKLVDVRASTEKAEIECEEALNAENFDQRRANDAVEKLVTARGDMTRLISQMGVRLRGILTTDQWRELHKRRQGMREGMMNRPGMGPMGGEPGGMRGRGPGPGRMQPPPPQKD